ncbi:hypothetical protein CK203_001527 [Vitis vinifera]|uniref:CW-type domain-containing protein n=1 Tax=Vitis vinifera TaxID=29760 RepID=A0A438KLH9_VITVI|nr:hypothetical protein CK203_001527 [Vitis vinifera]
MFWDIFKRILKVGFLQRIWVGAKFGGYGSFLPTYQRSSSIWSHPKTPQRVQNYNKAISPNTLLMEGCPQIAKAPSNAHPSVKLGTTSCDAPSLHMSRVPSGNISVKQDSFLPSAPVMEMSPSKHGTSNKLVNPTGRRVPKVRIKVGSVSAEKKNAEIYSGLGLDNSPSSSLGNSPDESGGMPLESQETLQESPTSILQIMTSFAVPEGVLLSPLHDSFICLIRKKKFPRNSKPVPALEGSQEQPALSPDEAATLLVDEQVLKEKKTRLVGKSERRAEVKHGSGMDFKNDMAFPLKEEVENQFPEGKEHFSNDLKFTSLSNTLHDVGDSGKGTGRATEIFGEPNKDGLKERVFFSDLDKEEPLEPITGQDSGTSVQRNVKSSSLENTWECGVACSNKNVSADPREDVRYKGNKLPGQFRADSDMFRGKEDTDVGEMDPSQWKLGQKAVSHDHGRITMSCKKEKQLWEGNKKLKGAQINGEPAPHLAEEGLRIGFCSAPKDKHNLKSQKDTGEVEDNPRELLTDRKSEQMADRIDPLKRPGERAKVSDFKDVEKGGSAFFKSKGRSSGKRVENQYASEASLQVALNPPFTENRSTTKMVPAAVAPVVIEENWVCCDSCQKWRLLPFGKKPEHLPEKWLCSMLSWLPGLNHCDISEEETTKALMHLTLDDVRHPGQNHQNPSSHDMPNEGKKKYGCKKMSNAGNNSGQIPNSAKNHRQEPLKSRSLIDMHKLDVEKHIHKQKEKNMKKGDLEQTKTKSKREADNYGGEASKKAKTEDACYSGKNCNFKHGRDLGKVCLISDTTLPTKATGKEVIKSNEICYSVDSNCDKKDKMLLSVKKLEDQAQVSLHGGSLAMKTSDKRDIALEERKLNEWEDIENQTDVCQITKDLIQENKVFVKKENSEMEFRKEKKTKLSIEGVESNTSKGDDRSRKGVMTRILLSGTKDDEVDNIEEVRIIEKNQQHKMCEEKIASQQTLDSIDSMKKDLGTGKVSMAATSSSSKVSGSRKTRANFQEVKGSPAESVSSSPLRASKLDNLTSDKGGILRKDDATDGGLSMVGNLGRCLNGVGNRSCNQSGAPIKEKVSSVFPPKSLELHALDNRDGDAKPKFSAKAKPSELGNSRLVKGDAVTSEQHHEYGNDLHAVEHCDNENHFCDSALFHRNLVEEDLHASKSLRCKLENDTQHLAPHPETVSDVKHSFPGRGCIKYNDDEKNHVNKGNSLGKCLYKSATPQKFLNKSFAKKTDLKELESRGETLQLFPYREGERETLARDFQSVPGSQKERVFDLCSVGASASADVSKVLKEPGNAVATNALKEAKDLRDYADRLKSSGFGFESYETYFQAAVKFLHGASLLETCNSDGGKNGVMTQIQAYSTAAKLCERCAYEYERRQEMAAAALAYKCMEVACMRVVYCKHSSINRDRHELQATLQIAPKGASPSSSASDIDNLNNQTMTDKAALSKVSHVGGKHVIVARNHPNFVRLLDFAQDVNFAIEASRKSQKAFVAANLLLEEAQNREGITSVRRVIDFSFQDVEGLIRLVRLAQEAISIRKKKGGKRSQLDLNLESSKGQSSLSVHVYKNNVESVYLFINKLSESLDGDIPVASHATILLALHKCLRGSVSSHLQYPSKRIKLCHFSDSDLGNSEEIPITCSEKERLIEELCCGKVNPYTGRGCQRPLIMERLAFHSAFIHSFIWDSVLGMKSM